MTGDNLVQQGQAQAELPLTVAVAVAAVEAAEDPAGIGPAEAGTVVREPSRRRPGRVGIMAGPNRTHRG